MIRLSRRWGRRLAIVLAGVGTFVLLLLLAFWTILRISPLLNEAALDADWAVHWTDVEWVHYRVPPRRILHPVYGLWLEPSSTMIMDAHAAGQRPAGVYGVRIDEDGFRLHPTGTTFRDADVLILGGSVAWGWGLDHAQSLAGIIERHFDVRVANLAMPDVTSVQILRVLEHVLPDSKARLLVLMTGLHDSCIGTAEDPETWARNLALKDWYEQNPGHLYFPDWIIGFLDRIRRPRIRSSRVPLPQYRSNLQRILQQAATSGASALVAVETSADLELLGRPEIQEEFWRHHRRGGSHLAKWISDRPDRWEREALFLGAFPRYVRAAREIARSRDLPVVDLNEGIRRTAEGEVQRRRADFFGKPFRQRADGGLIHTTPEGMRAAATTLIEQMKAMGFPQRPEPRIQDHAPFHIAEVPLDLESIPLEPTVHYLSALVVVETEGQPLRSHEAFYLGPEGEIQRIRTRPLARGRYRIFAHTDDLERLRFWTWRVGFKARAKVREGKIVLGHREGTALRAAIADQPNAFVTYVIVDMPLI